MLSAKERRLLKIVGLAWLGWAVFVSIYTSLFVQNNPLAQRILNPSFDWGPTLTTYDVVGISPNFIEQWQVSDIFIAQSFIARSNLIALEDGLFFVGSTHSTGFPALQKVNMQTGLQEWQSQQIESFSLLVAGSKQNVVVGSGIPGTVTVFDTASGDVVSERTFSFTTKGVDYILAAEGKLFVNTSPVRFQIIEEDSGKTIPFGNVTDLYPIYLVQNGIIYHRVLGNSLQAVDEQTGRMIWGRGFDEDIVHYPLFTEENILVRTGKSTGHIYALDRLTGETLWVSEPGVVSNVAAVGNWVYYLTEEAHLHVADLQTGMLIGDIVFSPAILDLADIEQVNSHFYVAATEDTAVVYFSSSNQLFAFQHIPKE